MEKMRLGRTDIMASRSAFGALPIQRTDTPEAVALLRKAYDNGINFYDTARAYTNSEEKLALAFEGLRSHIFIATKTQATDKKGLFSDLETSLRTLKTDVIDIYQLHNPPAVPDYDDPDGLYQGLVEAKKKGYIRFFGFTNHRLKVAIQAAEEKRFDTVQYPLSFLSSERDLELVSLCKKNDIGFIAMKALSGGLITNVAPSFVFLRQLGNVLPIWGIQRESELLEFIGLEKNPPELNDAMKEIMEKDRRDLSGNFCRGCGYCQPCPVGIPIEFATRITYMFARAPFPNLLTEEFKEKMERIENCTHCNHCKNHCPYGLDTPSILRHMLGEYRAIYAARKG